MFVTTVRTYSAAPAIWDRDRHRDNTLGECGGGFRGFVRHETRLCSATMAATTKNTSHVQRCARVKQIHKIFVCNRRPTLLWGTYSQRAPYLVTGTPCPYFFLLWNVVQGIWKVMTDLNYSRHRKPSHRARIYKQTCLVLSKMVGFYTNAARVPQEICD